MTAMTLFWVLFSLTLGIWFLVLISLWYGRKLLERQKIMISHILPYLQQVERDRSTMQSLAISDDTLLSDLEDVRLPNNVEVNFKHTTRG